MIVSYIKLPYKFHIPTHLTLANPILPSNSPTISAVSRMYLALCELVRHCVI